MRLDENALLHTIKCYLSERDLINARDAVAIISEKFWDMRLEMALQIVEKSNRMDSEDETLP